MRFQYTKCLYICDPCFQLYVVEHNRIDNNVCVVREGLYTDFKIYCLSSLLIHKIAGSLKR